jgi:hypothetical protein
MDVQNSMTPYSGKLQIKDRDLSRIDFLCTVLSHSAANLLFFIYDVV